MGDLHRHVLHRLRVFVQDQAAPGKFAHPGEGAERNDPAVAVKQRQRTESLPDPAALPSAAPR